MSDFIGHECGVAAVRLLKPLDYYREKYGSALYGFNKLFLLMEKQHNRGQDGAGIAALKLDTPPGYPYLFRERNIKSNALDNLFKRLHRDFEELADRSGSHTEDSDWLKRHYDFAAEAYVGHLRYGTSGGYSRRSCHPYVRRNNWPAKNLLLAGNFNMTNSREMDERLIAKGQHPIFDTDTQAVLEEIGLHLDEVHDNIHRYFLGKGLEGAELAERIRQELDPAVVLRRAAADWDGGYALIGMLGCGDLFAFRDPAGIRPLHYYRDEEIVAIASEAVPLVTIFDIKPDAVLEVPPGGAIIVRYNGEFRQESILPPISRRSCSFERIYFSRGNDQDIYRERKLLGGLLADQILDAIGDDLNHTVFGFIPNTAETAFFGLMERLRMKRRAQVKQQILEASAKGELTDDIVDRIIMRGWPMAEKIAVKDIKMRTFISQEKGRNELASHVYDVSYGSCPPGDQLVCIDDSIVRGTTLRQSIIRILSRLEPSHIIIASTAPQIRYPDCYGIDMSRLDRFIAFQAALSLLRERGLGHLLDETHHLCREQEHLPANKMVNHVRRLYEPFTDDEISARIAELVTPDLPEWKGRVTLIFQTIPHLRHALPEHTGDWYFTGDYPTPGGYKVLNQSFLNAYRKLDQRSY